MAENKITQVMMDDKTIDASKEIAMVLSIGPIGTTLPSNDTSIKTHAGDIMLYTSDQMVIFYGSNSWSYTRLGKITDKSPSELRDLLSGSSVTVTIMAE